MILILQHRFNFHHSKPFDDLNFDKAFLKIFSELQITDKIM